MGARRRGATATADADGPDARWATTLATALADAGAVPGARDARGARRKRAVGGGGSTDATATKAREAVRDAARALFATADASGDRGGGRAGDRAAAGGRTRGRWVGLRAGVDAGGRADGAGVGGV